MPYTLSGVLWFTLSVWGIALPAPEPAGGIPGPLTLIQDPHPATDDFGFTPEPPNVPRWPMSGVGTIWADNSKSTWFPNINMTFTGYQSSSCPKGPISDYQFLNGTRKDATYQDMVNDLDTAFNSQDSNVDMVDLYLAQTVALLYEVYVLVNDTMSWFDIPDAPPGGLLPVPKGLAKQNLLLRNSATAKVRRMDEIQHAGNDPTDVRVNIDQLDTPVPGPVDIAPGVLPDPALQDTAIEEAEVVKSTQDRIWDGSIQVMTVAIGSSLSYGALNAGSYIPYVTDHAWLANFFGAAGIAIGIYTAILVGIIQRERAAAIDMARREAAKIKQAAKDRFTADQIATFRQIAETSREEVKYLREVLKLSVKAATPNLAQVQGAVSKPIKSASTSALQLAGNAGKAINRQRPFGKFKDAANRWFRRGGSRSAPATLGDPDRETLYALREPRVIPQEMQQTRNAPVCAIPEATAAQEADNETIQTNSGHED